MFTLEKLEAFITKCFETVYVILVYLVIISLFTLNYENGLPKTPCRAFLDAGESVQVSAFSRRACVAHLMMFTPESFTNISYARRGFLLLHPPSDSNLRSNLQRISLPEPHKVRDTFQAVIAASGTIIATGLSFILVESLWNGDIVSQVENFLQFLFFFCATLVTLFAFFARTFYALTTRLFGLHDHEVSAKIMQWMFPWRAIYGVFLELRMWKERAFKSIQASAKWATLPETLYYAFQPGRIPIGRASFLNIPLPDLIALPGGKERHVCIVAAVGSGKTTFLTTMLALHEGSSFVIDCDGQMVNAIGQRLGKGGKGVIGKGNKVVLLDPFRLSQAGRSASWNPFDEIDAAVARNGRDAAIDVAQTMAAALIRTLELRNAWVYDQARMFLASLIIYIWLYEPQEKKNLVRLRELTAIGLRGVEDEKYDPFQVLLFEMRVKQDFDGLIAKGAALMETAQSADGKNIPRTEILSQMAWLDLPQMTAICKRSDFHCEDLKKGMVNLFIVAGITDIQTKLSGWVRCLTMMTMEAFQKCKERPQTPCLFAIDEAPSLRIETLPTFAATFRKYGGRLVTITQNLERLKEAYPNNWGGFLGDAECTIWMANDHKFTLEYLSGILGTKTGVEEVKPAWWRRLLFKEKPHAQQVERPLMYPHQLREYLNNNVIVTISGRRPMRLKPAPYYTELPITHYKADRFYGEKLLRAQARLFTESVGKDPDEVITWAEKWMEKKSEILLKKIGSYLKKTVLPFFDPEICTSGIGWFGSIFCALVAGAGGAILAVGWTAGFPNLFIGLGSLITLLCGGFIALLGIGGIIGCCGCPLMEAYNRVTGEKEGSYPLTPVLFFCKGIVLVFAWMALQTILPELPIVTDSALLSFLLWIASTLNAIVTAILMVIGALFASFCIFPSLYGTSFAVIYSFIRIERFLKSSNSTKGSVH